MMADTGISRYHMEVAGCKPEKTLFVSLSPSSTVFFAIFAIL